MANRGKWRGEACDVGQREVARRGRAIGRANAAIELHQRVVRGRFLALREEDFVLAARLDGAKPRRLIFRHMMPSIYSHVIASLTLTVPGLIIAETALSYLGVGLRPPAVSWGVQLQEAQKINVIATYPWVMFPALAVIVIVLAFNYLGDGLRDAADPY